MNAIIIDAFNEIALALLKTGRFLPDITLQAAMDNYSEQ